MLLRGGDLLLSVGGEPIGSFAAAEAALQGREEVDVTVLRDGETVHLTCKTRISEGLGTRKVVGWAGLLLQATALYYAILCYTKLY